MMKHVSLFSGIGGLDLAAEAAGFITVGQCELAEYPYQVLCKHWPDVPKWRNIRDITKESFYEQTGLRAVDLISGGFPCQPFSVAGKHKGKGDDRYLWPEMLRVIRELAPRWVVGENVPGILRIAAADIVQSLECEGYHVVMFAFEAASVGALHRRERVAFVAHADSQRCQEQYISTSKPEKRFSCRTDRTEIVSNNGEQRCNREFRREDAYKLAQRCRWAAEPRVGRVAHGVPHRVDRLKTLGNAVVPAQFYPVFKAIFETENKNIRNL